MAARDNREFKYDAKTSWTNSLFLDFAPSGLTELMQDWRAEHHLTDFPAHATLLTVDENTFPPDSPDTALKVAEAVQEVLQQLSMEELCMHVDGLLKFGDYSPHSMRMLQIEATGNFGAECLSGELTMDDGNGVRKLYPTPQCGAPSESVQTDYHKLQVLREQLCLRLGPQAGWLSCRDHSQWKPHVSVAYVNEGETEGLSEQMVLDFQQRLSGRIGAQKACSVSYWEMRGRIASQWEERSCVTLPDLQIQMAP